MPLTQNHVLSTEHISAYTPSCGASPVVAYIRAPFRGAIRKFTGILGGAITTANGTITVAVNGTTIGTFTVTQAGSAAGQLFSGAPATAALAAVNEDDVISFTPSGASGTSVPLYCSVAIRAD